MTSNRQANLPGGVCEDGEEGAAPPNRGGADAVTGIVGVGRAPELGGFGAGATGCCPGG